jgi:hypothetical protein
LGVLVWWRGQPIAGQLCWAIGAALILFGLVLPDALRPVYRVWMGLALALSKVTTPVFLGIVYFGILTPIGVVRRLFRHDALTTHRGAASSWVSRRAATEPSTMKHQF